MVDGRWDSHLHRPLHAATYYLNHILQNSHIFNVDYEIKPGLSCLQRMVRDVEKINKIDRQLEDFRKRSMSSDQILHWI